MSYTVLSRKWRPKTFEHVIGQDHITKILKNSISQDKVSHAYLFSGPRGVGKTTIARILSCVLNKVEKVEDSIDIIELDGASNRGIDEIREIKESVRYAPSQGSYKIFIIDESHMLTKEAFNALLKTLEEPPPNVIFILATTEYNKLPLTIVSRCQRYSFKRISINSISEYLKIILSKESLDCEDNALASIAYKADGSMRDALSLLDKVITLSDNNIISESIVKNALGIIDEEEYLKIIKSIVNKNFETVFNSIEKLLADGVSILNFMDGFNVYLKNITYYLSNYRKNISISEKTVSFIKESQFSIQITSKLLDVNLEYLIKNNHDLSNISLENHFIKIFSFVNRHSVIMPSPNDSGKEDSEKNNNIPVSNKSNAKAVPETDINLSPNPVADDDKPTNSHVSMDRASFPKSNIEKAYIALIDYFERNDYKLYCVLSKCDISSFSTDLIKIDSKKLSSYEQNSINMEIDKINEKLNNIIEQEFNQKLKIQLAFDIDIETKRKTEDRDSNAKSNMNQSIAIENEKKTDEDEDHPLFDSVIDDLEGKLLK